MFGPLEQQQRGGIEVIADPELLEFFRITQPVEIEMNTCRPATSYGSTSV